jgi:serine protease inhibitor
MPLSRRSQFVPAAALLLGVAAACGDASGPPSAPAIISQLPRQLSAGEQAIIAAGNTFGFDLLRELNATRADSNIFISPLSASMALGMTLNGASGETFDEMRSTLALDERPLDEINASYASLITLLRGLDRQVDFRLANAIWFEDTFASAIAPSFLTTTKTHFDATVQGLDFSSPQALTTINDWVKQSTSGKIEKMLDEIDSDVVMYLMNAIYFKGSWREAFERAKTSNQPFAVRGGSIASSPSVPTMFGKVSLRHGRMGNVDVVELPYGGDAFVMTILLPDEGRNVNDVVSSLDVAQWTSATGSLAAPRDLDIYLPRVKMSLEYPLNESLQRLGMPSAFQPYQADFSRLSPSRGRELYIDEVRQKTFVDVNEEGTEAAAVTSVGIVPVSLPPTIRVDRPYVFALRERISGTILFLGKVVDPR